MLQEEEFWTKKEDFVLQKQGKLLAKAAEAATQSAAGDRASGIESGIGDDYVKERFKANRRQVRRKLSEITKEKRIMGLAAR